MTPTELDRSLFVQYCLTGKTDGLPRGKVVNFCRDADIHRASYYSWIKGSLSHSVSGKVAKGLGLPDEWGRYLGEVYVGDDRFEKPMTVPLLPASRYALGAGAGRKDSYYQALLPGNKPRPRDDEADLLEAARATAEKLEKCTNGGIVAVIGPARCGKSTVLAEAVSIIARPNFWIDLMQDSVAVAGAALKGMVWPSSVTPDVTPEEAADLVFHRLGEEPEQVKRTVIIVEHASAKDTLIGQGEMESFLRALEALGFVILLELRRGGATFGIPTEQCVEIAGDKNSLRTIAMDDVPLSILAWTVLLPEQQIDDAAIEKLASSSKGDKERLVEGRFVEVVSTGKYSGTGASPERIIALYDRLALQADVDEVVREVLETVFDDGRALNTAARRRIMLLRDTMPRDSAAREASPKGAEGFRRLCGRILEGTEGATGGIIQRLEETAKEAAQGIMDNIMWCLSTRAGDSAQSLIEDLLAGREKTVQFVGVLRNSPPSQLRALYTGFRNGTKDAAARRRFFAALEPFLSLASRGGMDAENKLQWGPEKCWRMALLWVAGAVSIRGENLLAFESRLDWANRLFLFGNGEGTREPLEGLDLANQLLYRETRYQIERARCHAEPEHQDYHRSAYQITKDEECSRELLDYYQPEARGTWFRRRIYHLCFVAAAEVQQGLAEELKRQLDRGLKDASIRADWIRSYCTVQELLALQSLPSIKTAPDSSDLQRPRNGSMAILNVLHFLQDQSRSANAESGALMQELTALAGDPRFTSKLADQILADCQKEDMKIAKTAKDGKRLKAEATGAILRFRDADPRTRWDLSCRLATQYGYCDDIPIDSFLYPPPGVASEPDVLMGCLRICGYEWRFVEGLEILRRLLEVVDGDEDLRRASERGVWFLEPAIFHGDDMLRPEIVPHIEEARRLLARCLAETCTLLPMSASWRRVRQAAYTLLTHASEAGWKQLADWADPDLQGNGVWDLGKDRKATLLIRLLCYGASQKHLDGRLRQALARKALQRAREVNDDVKSKSNLEYPAYPRTKWQFAYSAAIAWEEDAVETTINAFDQLPRWGTGTGAKVRLTIYQAAQQSLLEVRAESSGHFANYAESKAHVLRKMFRDARGQMQRKVAVAVRLAGDCFEFQRFVQGENGFESIDDGWQTNGGQHSTVEDAVREAQGTVRAVLPPAAALADLELPPAGGLPAGTQDAAWQLIQGA